MLIERIGAVFWHDTPPTVNFFLADREERSGMAFNILLTGYFLQS
jgi:hypothetical protein